MKQIENLYQRDWSEDEGEEAEDKNCNREICT